MRDHGCLGVNNVGDCIWDNVNSDIVFDELPVSPGLATTGAPMVTEEIAGQRNRTEKVHKGMKKKRKDRKRRVKEERKRQRLVKKLRKELKEDLKKDAAAKALKKNEKKKKIRTTPAPFLPFLDTTRSKKRVLRQKSLYDGENDDEDSDFSGSGSIPEITGDRSFQMSFTMLEPWKDDYSNRRSPGYKFIRGNITESLEGFFNDILLDFDDQNHINANVRKLKSNVNNIDVVADVTAEHPVSLAKLSRELGQQIRNYHRIGKLDVEATNYVFNTIVECREDEFRCNDGKCISAQLKCNQIPDCLDNEDEDLPECPIYNCLENEFTCGNGGCIPKENQCDGVTDCQDETDEQDCEDDPTRDISDNDTDQSCTVYEFQCDNGMCIDTRDRCNGREDCSDGSDEQKCEECIGDAFHCNSGECIHQSLRCNKRQDCADLSDEHDCGFDPAGGTCKANEWQCFNGECINKDFVCDGSRDCFDNSDEANCDARQNEPEAVQCASSEFMCDERCIPEDYVCDGRVDCSDASDENDCPTNGEAGQGVGGYPGQPSPPQPFPRLCPELVCRSDYTCFSYSQRCDRVRDCADGTDEEGCPPSPHPQQPPQPSQPTPPSYPVRPDSGAHVIGPSWSQQGDIKLKTYPSDQIIKEGREVVFQCRDEGSARARVRWTRANGALPQNSKDINGRLEISNVQVSDSGEYYCEAVGYQTYSGARTTVYLTVERYNPILDAPVGCPPEKATCMNGECIEKNQVCDGTYDCSDASDETGCSRANSCEPNEFRCANRKCVAKTWRCDGENDCGDNSDEQECATMPPDAPCRFHEFQCKIGQCIPKSYQCDNHPDCFDNSDEIGCSKPTVVQSPPPRMHLSTGSIFNITCRAVGIPMPLVVWRLNWGHIPDKCTTTSVNGYGVLTCPGIEVRDSGAYSCEVINSMGTQFASPDTILVVDGTDVCPSGYFNSKATRQEDCINCFCFGVSTQCSSADLYIYSLPPPVTSLHVVGVTGPWIGEREIDVTPYQAHDIIATKFGIKVRLADSIRETAFYALPREYLGNQLKSYGGFLTYDLEYVGGGPLNQAPDVLVFGNGYKLSHKIRGPITSESLHQVKVEFHVGEWYKDDGRRATREELMMVLANIDNFLIKIKFTDNQPEVQLRNIRLDSAATIDRGLGSATLVEQCRCPVGYSGLSCEECADGYVREETGTWLGRCVKAQTPCPAGTYLPPGELSCVTCPCPGGPYGTNYGYSCYVAADGEVACNCKPGYAGRRCEQCAPGFTGNPLVPGDICREQPTSDCDPQGTRTVGPDGRCICKNNVLGRRCDQCAPNTFYLNPETPNGCIHCFCMGVARQCMSSNYYRDTIQSTLYRDRSDFDIVYNYDDPQLGDPQSIQASSYETVFRNIQHDDTEVYYWSLPTRFVGDKITSYGGVLNYTIRYTPQPGSAMSRNSAPDVVIKSDNDITILHFRKDEIRPNTPQSYSVPLLENQWQRSDGKEVNREHLLMTLADVSYIFIKATYTTTTEEAALSHVSLDIAVPRESGQTSGRAYEVEMCQCPQGYKGLSCEDCAQGYMRSDQGLYLGLCEPCQCNGHSNDCDPITGVCINCEHNTKGDNCELCIDGRGNATGGTPYDCTGSSDLTGCDQCDSRGFVSCSNNQCQCKSNVIGGPCDRCRPGTFDLQTENPEGCTSCFCFGASDTCAASRLYREEIPMIIFSDHFRITLNENQLIADHEELATDIPTNTVSYQVLDDRTLYWSLPSQFIGNQIHSYGGTLSYKLSTEDRGDYVRDSDVIIRGNGLTLTWQNDNEDHSSVVVPFIAGAWMNGYQYATREDILTALANLEFILVRATTHQSTTSTHISDIILQTAVTQRTVLGTADHIEVCRCPPGYTGSSCESCDVMHYRETVQGGRPGVCRRCPCSEHAESCSEDAYRRLTCHCLPGYTGEMCDIPEAPVTPDSPTISVVVTAPTLQIVEVGQTVYINCTGRHVISNLPIVVRWFKLDGRLSERAHTDRGTLVITNTQVDDSGVYVCRGEKGEEVVEQRVSITVSYSRRPEVNFYPSSLDVEEYTTAQVTCEATGSPPPIIVWERIDALGRSTVLLTPENSGVLRFGSIRKADEGQYRCTARNKDGEDSKTLIVRVREQAVYPPPITEISIIPQSYTGRPGDSVEFRCIGDGQISWRKEYTMWLPPSAIVRGHILSIENAREDDSGQYVCTALHPTGQQFTTVANLTIIEHEARSYPKIRPLEQSHLLIENADLYLACDATGSPLPTVKWTKLHDAFDPNVQQIGNQLRILGAKQYNRGVYVCVAENSEGTDQISTIIEIDQRQAPIVELHPKGPQTIRIGESAMLSCRSVAGIPTPVVRWVRLDNKPLPLNVDDKYPGTIIIRNAAIEDGGSYQCIGENIAGSTSATAVLNVHQPPEVTIEPAMDTLEVTEGDELTLTCRAIGFPAPTVQWIAPNMGAPNHFGARPSQRSPVVIQKFEVKPNDAGMYRCLANSSAGQDEHFIRVIVKGKRGDVGPHDRDYPGHSGSIYPQDPSRIRPGEGDTAHHTYTVNVGQRAQLSCEVEDSYRMTTWRRTDGYPLPHSANLTGGTLVIERTEPDAAGTYECVMLDTEVPFIIALTQVVVLDVPMITFSPAMPIVVKSGENVVIFCNATGEGPIQVFWHGINYTPLPHTVRGEGPHLLFAPITQRDAGKYYCTATNVNGNVTKAAEVIVNRNEIVDRQPMYDQVQEVYEGDKVTLDCHVPDQMRMQGIQFMWRRENGQISPNAHYHDGRLTLRDIHTSDAGRYICEMLLPNQSITQSYVDVRIKSEYRRRRHRPHREYPIRNPGGY
ncbi:basement membrane-specific heparan sulfate proteoglycan core protein isoform X2 [Lutzomyia longipalpis]|uniref:basement membrane-specific heparan sulfate proteoglycan core protein isoform X2 n=1 Tax=Lutzomyia longipalpis TaxID=7200 RepID=UPI0024842F3F|nr:basement membrane-specific heparan sulfate proteoglycan core protein isoform X2 [Lutzomyia longipalpis]